MAAKQGVADAGPEVGHQREKTRRPPNLIILSLARSRQRTGKMAMRRDATIASTRASIVFSSSAVSGTG